MAKITLQKWGARWCGPCVELAKAKTLDKFKRAHPEVKVEIHDDSAKGSAAWGERADEMKIKNLPTLVWLHGDEELFRTSDVRPEALERQLERAKKAVGLL